MKFEETRNITTVPNVCEPIIFCLLDNGEVVYVGQSKNGLRSAYQDTTRIFDSISFFACKEDELDKIQADMILKYQPKYNRTLPGKSYFSFRKTRELVRQETRFKTFSLFDLKKMIKEIGLTVYAFDGVSYIKAESFEKILCFLNEDTQ